MHKHEDAGKLTVDSECLDFLCIT